MSRPVSSTSCRTSESRSYRWFAVLTIAATLGVAGFALASTSTNHPTKIVPAGQDVKTNRATASVIAEAPAQVNHGNSVHSGNAPLAPPANDDCTGAIVIPSGSLPYVTAPVDITDATPQDVDEGNFTCATVDRTVWYSFTPTSSGQYVFSSCGVTATGSTVYDTVIALFDSTGGVCPEGASLACNDSAACAADLPAAPYVDQGTLAAVLTAGETYFVVVGHWSQDLGGVVPGSENVAISVELSPAPENDTCASPTPLTLGQITHGTTASATNDYRSGAACFTGVGQIASSSNGLDVVFSFTPPDAGKYSFRYVQDDSSSPLRSQSPVLYLADNCPAPNNTVAVGGCLAAANRMNDQLTGNGNRSEEINCVDLAAGTPYYLFFDDRFTGNPGGPLDVEVTKCQLETEPNDTPETATSYAPNSSCIMEGSSIPSGPAGDIDFFSLGSPAAGSKIFAGIDAAASNESDYELRVTTSTDTLGYDDNDGSSWIGSEAPIVAGPFAPGGEVFARINSKSVIAGNEPYNLYARVETGSPQNEDPELEPGGVTTFFSRFVNATHMTGGGYVAGVMSTIDDEDCFRFVAHEGDNIAAFSDNNPARVGGTITNVFPILQKIDANAQPGNTRFFGQVVRNLGMPGPAPGLDATTPSATSQFEHYRARYTGAYMICYAVTTDVNNVDNPPAASYPLAYNGSVSLNCGPVPGPTTSDVSITKSGPVGAARTGDIVDYTITLTNNDATNIAQDIRVIDTLPPEVTYVGATVNDGGFTRNTFCTVLPTPGQNDAPLDCVSLSLAPGASITYVISVQVNNCIGAGVEIQNSATVQTFTPDNNLANNSASWSFTTTEDGGCNDLLCDAGGCVANACTVNDHCEAGVCVSAPLNCDDNSLCTEDSCNPSDTDGNPCTNDSSQLGDLCFDGNDCTLDQCDPAQFCVFPPATAGQACDDFQNCTNGDVCDGNGACVGHSVCDDGLPCTDDFADENNACACDNPLSFPGTICDDGNACTSGTTCDGVDGTAASCNGGSDVSCDDSNPCTDDSCDPQLGCVHTNNSNACDDGNVCTTGDTCGGGTCNPGGPAACDDGDACNGVETCNPASGCVAGTPLSCNDGNACNGVETCNPASGCVAGIPVVCTAADQCHDAGTCDSGSGLCSNPAKPDGTTCDDGNASTSPDACQAGVCVGSSACTSTNDPKTWGWYHSLCTSGGHSGDSITDADAACVASTPAFAGFSSASQVCDVLDPSHGNNGPDGKAAKQLITLALNICKHRLCPIQGLDATCTNAQSVGQALSEGSAVMVNPSHTNSQLATVECQSTEINNGHALELNTLTLKRETGNMRLNWTAPILDDGTGRPSSYKVWRRAMGSMSPFVQIGTTTGTTFLDTTAGTAAWQYDLTPVN